LDEKKIQKTFSWVEEKMTQFGNESTKSEGKGRGKKSHRISPVISFKKPETSQTQPKWLVLFWKKPPRRENRGWETS